MIGTCDVFYLYYQEENNMFTDEHGNVIYDLFNIITPQNLFLFRYDNGFNCFPIIGEPNMLCEIISIPDEVCGNYAPYEYDPGEDYERIERYTRARLSGCFI